MHLAHLQLLINTSAMFKVNHTETVGGVVRTSILSQIMGNNSVILDGISTNVRLAHLQLLMNTSAKYQANWTETVGGVVWTRFCRLTDRPTG